MFEIVEPLLEGDEVFDSSMLRQMVESMISTGKRNVCVDLSQLDYLYSDTINALIVINRRMLDVMGRLSLLAPQPSVMEILKKSGVHNILKIFVDDAELIRTSEELMGMGAVPGAASPAPSAPRSEFDDLRNEIGSAFEAPSPVSSMPPSPPRTQAPAPEFAQPFQAPQPTMPPPRQAYVPPSPPRYAPPPLRPFETAPRPAARAYTPPPPKPAPLTGGGETRRMPSVSETPSSLRPPSAPVIEEDLDKFEATLEKKPSASIAEKTRRDRFDEDFDEIPKKKSVVPVLVALIVLLVLAGGGYFGYTTFFQKAEKTAPAVQTPTPAVKPEPSIPQLPVEPVVEQPKTPEPVKEEVKKVEPIVKKAEPVKPVVTPRPKPRPRPAVVAAKPKPVEEPKPVATKPEPKKAEPVAEAPVEKTPASNIEVFDDEPPAPAKTAAAVKPSQPKATTPPVEATPEPPAAGGEAATVFIASIPPVADIYMDGKLIGKTNISELKVTAGTHSLRFVKGDKEITKQQTFQPGKNPSMMVRIP
ncbi:MAG: PEGA domain-containing protein [Chitinispirillaceae bacterium]|nr:PEGA domain-containing protein [Chitinispirillaceae bacterium]